MKHMQLLMASAFFLSTFPCNAGSVQTSENGKLCSTLMRENASEISARAAWINGYISQKNQNLFSDGMPFKALPDDASQTILFMKQYCAVNPNERLKDVAEAYFKKAPVGNLEY